MRSLCRSRAGLLLFEPEKSQAARAPCSYVVHPLTEQLSSLRRTTRNKNGATPTAGLLFSRGRPARSAHLALFGAALALVIDIAAHGARAAGRHAQTDGDT